MRGGYLGHASVCLIAVRAALCLFVCDGCVASVVCFVLLSLTQCVVICFVLSYMRGGYIGHVLVFVIAVRYVRC